MTNLENKNIIITGASSGIGKALCNVLSSYGANVIMIARNAEKLNNIAQSIGREKCWAYPFDLKNTGEIEGIVKQIVAERGKLDGFVHCAGVGPTRPLNLTGFDFLHDVMLINFYAFVEMARVYAKKKNNNGGSIVAISSIAGLKGDSAKTAYCASKAAVDGAVRSLAVELRAKGIRVNAVQPGWVRTEMYEEYIKAGGEDAQHRFDANPKNTIVEPEEVAETIAFLLSDKASVLSGVSMLTNAVGL